MSYEVIYFYSIVVSLFKDGNVLFAVFYNQLISQTCITFLIDVNISYKMTNI